MNQLARQVEMDQGLLSKIERGLRPPPEIVPHVQRIAEALGFKRESAEYQELVNAAVQERFAKRKQGGPMGTKGSIVSFVLADPDPPPGLAGLPPELTPPDSNAGQYYAALRAKAVETVRSVESRMSPPDHDQEQPLGAKALLVLPEFVLHEAIDFMFLRGIQLTSFEQQDESFRCSFKLPNGAEYEVRIRPKSPPIRGEVNTDAEQGD
jgi:transcriptional regulator with XRE-family HTH domain